MNKINTDVNYRTMAGNARLLMLGESSHNAAIYKYEAIKALRQLKAAGFTHFAIEMLPLYMQEKIELYQRTGKGFKVIQQYFDEYWNRGYLVPKSYGDLVKAAREIGLKIVALDLTLDEMIAIDDSCDFEMARTGSCSTSHSVRNMVWTQNISNILKQSNQNRVVAFMHRWHAVSSNFQVGLDTLVIDQGILKIKFIDFIGGKACRTINNCEGYSDEDGELKNKYFYSEGFPFKHAVTAYQVHIPENGFKIGGL
ncbi:ChaN family lipoprotein [Pseudocolwellia agarivorans]|uniref:ChaN family lipoprotein n=1 Tax=Pseudocolwellia agarivorans TaxID=1911682 RepID=UPI0009874145|nr:ChaN family lipoprotein [Pseudocolwellia agarivorans]